MKPRLPVTVLIITVLTLSLLAVAARVSGQQLPAQSPQPHQPQQLEQQTLSIRGNRALPRTLYIAPWKQLGAPLQGAPFESRVGDPLEPLEQDLFRRQLELFEEGYSVDTVPAN